MGHVMSRSKARKHPRLAIAVGGTAGVVGSVGATADTTVRFDGEVLVQCLFEGYDSKNALTRTIAFLDENGVTLYAAPGLTDAANTVWRPTYPVCLDGLYTVRDLQSGAGATAGVDRLTLFVE